jgi:hypothetical protein
MLLLPPVKDNFSMFIFSRKYSFHCTSYPSILHEYFFKGNSSHLLAQLTNTLAFVESEALVNRTPLTVPLSLIFSINSLQLIQGFLKKISFMDEIIIVVSSALRISEGRHRFKVA